MVAVGGSVVGQVCRRGTIKVKTNEDVLILYVKRARLNVFGNKSLPCVRRDHLVVTQMNQNVSG